MSIDAILLSLLLALDKYFPGSESQTFSWASHNRSSLQSPNTTIVVNLSQSYTRKFFFPLVEKANISWSYFTVNGSHSNSLEQGQVDAMPSPKNKHIVANKINKFMVYLYNYDLN